MHVVEKLSLSVGHASQLQQFTWEHQMPVPVVSVQTVVFSPIGNAVLESASESREILVMVDDQRLRLRNERENMMQLTSAFFYVFGAGVNNINFVKYLIVHSYLINIYINNNKFVYR